ncbi:unnamed protein product [Mucor hiemalis]
MTRDSTSNITLFSSNPTTPNSYFEKSSPTYLFEDDNIPLDTNREFLLFPTYAKRNPSDASQWIVRAKGWALSHNSSTAKQKMMMGITKSVAGKSSADRNSSQMFEERFKYFLATNKRHKHFLIQAIGITTLEESRINMSVPKEFMFLNQQSPFNETTTMLSTRFNHLISSPTITHYYQVGKKQIMKSFQYAAYPITPPTDDDSDNEEEDDEEWSSSTNTMEDPVLHSRPSNPISSVLDGNYFDIIPPQFRKRSSLSMIESLDTTTTSASNEEVEEGGVHLKTKGSGFLSGQFLIPHDNILNWAQEQNQCDARLIKIQSICTTENNKFLPNHNVVNLIEPTGISIISDIDDTIKDTQIKAGARTVLSKTFFESPKCVTGMADAYMAWYSQGASFHYVSNSPFQLMPMLDRFIRDSQFPPGSMHLRDDGKLISRLVETPGQAKRDAIIDILRDFPQRHFVLIGDSGEIDLEIYTRIAVEYPEQILKIYIRDVTTPTITELKKASTLSTSQSKQKKSSGPLSSLFHYPKRRSQSASDFVVREEESSSTDTEISKKKKFRSPLGVRRAVTTVLAEYAVEPHLTGHRSTLHIDDTKKASLSQDDDEEGLLDPYRFHKISTLEACEQLNQRVAKAKSQVSPHIDIILFQNAEVLQNDTDIRNALWDMWDEISNNSEIISSSPEEDDDIVLSSSPNYY